MTCVLPGFVFRGLNILITRDNNNNAIINKSYRAEFMKEHLAMAKKSALFVRTLGWMECYFDTVDRQLAKKNVWLRLRTYPNGEQIWSMRRLANDETRKCHNACLVVECIARSDMALVVKCVFSDLKPLAFYAVSRNVFSVSGGDLVFDAVRMPGTSQGFGMTAFVVNETSSVPKIITPFQCCSKLIGVLGVQGQTNVQCFFSPSLRDISQFEWSEDVEGELLKTIQDCLDVNLDVLTKLKAKILEGVICCCDDRDFLNQSADAFPDLVESLYESIDVVRLERDVFKKGIVYKLRM